MRTWHVIMAVGLAVVVAATDAPAWAVPPATALSQPGAPAASAPRGVAVVALGGATEAAWPLARAVYADPSLRPDLDELHARVLCGEAPPAGAAPELRDLADTVGALHGADAPTRSLLGDIAHRFGLRALVVVGVEGGQPSARAFLPDRRDFDAATYAPDPPAPVPSTEPPGAPITASQLSWNGAVQSVVRAFGSAPGVPPAAWHAPALAVHETPRSEGARPFYTSPWFWGALILAAAGGVTAYVVTRDSSPSTIHLEAQVPSR